MDKLTGKPRGFGFVVFENTVHVDKVMQDYNNHRIDGKWVEVKRATPQEQASSAPTPQVVAPLAQTPTPAVVPPGAAFTEVGPARIQQDFHPNPHGVIRTGPLMVPPTVPGSMP